MFIDSEQNLTSCIEPSRDYSPGGTGEGKLGSGISFAVVNTDKTDSMNYYSVLQPLRKDITPLPVIRKDTVKMFTDCKMAF